MVEKKRRVCKEYDEEAKRNCIAMINDGTDGI